VFRGRRRCSYPCLHNNGVLFHSPLKFFAINEVFLVSRSRRRCSAPPTSESWIRHCCHQRRATPEAATRCKLQQPPELLHLELSPTSRLHMIVDPSAPTMLRQNTPIEVPKKTTEPGHTLCVGGLASPTASHSSAKDSYT
jgi:hypothetical protein